MNKVIAVLLAIISFFVSFWLGEAGKGPFQIAPFAIALIGIIAIPSLTSQKWKHKAVSGITFLVLYAAAFYIGYLSFYQAYNSCIEQGEHIRTALSEFKTRTGQYPAVLDDLNMPLPCSRCLRGTILEYESTGSNYKICFKDWLVEHSATDKEGFLEHK